MTLLATLLVTLLVTLLATLLAILSVTLLVTLLVTVEAFFGFLSLLPHTSELRLFCMIYRIQLLKKTLNDKLYLIFHTDLSILPVQRKIYMKIHIQPQDESIESAIEPQISLVMSK